MHLPGRYRDCLLGLATFLSTVVSRAESSHWTPVGPFAPGGAVNALAIDASPPATLYAGTDAGLFKSVDGGASWRLSSDGLETYSVYALAVDQSAPGMLYAGAAGGIYKSTDGGTTWRPTYRSTYSAVTRVVVAQASPSVVYALEVYVGPSPGGVSLPTTILRSTNHGESWLPLPSIGFVQVGGIAADPASAGTVYLATSMGVLTTTDDFSTWSVILDQPAGALAIDPKNPLTIYAGGVGDPTHVFRSIDGGKSWMTSADVPRVLTLVVKPGGLPLAGTAIGIFQSSDDGATWLPTDGGPRSAVGTLGLQPSTPSVIFAGATSGLFRSANGGSSWSGLPTSFTTINVASVASVPVVPGLLFAGTDLGVFRTDDGGVSWAQVNAGLTSLNVRTLAVEPGLLRPCAPPCHSLVTICAGTGGGVFRSTNGGETWSPANAGLGSQNVASLAFGPPPNPLLFAGTSDFGIWKSADGGSSWQYSSTGLTDLRVRHVAVDPTNGSVAYAVAINDVFKTKDAGASWSRANAACCAWMLAVAPTNSSTLYLATQGLYRSLDGGSTWAHVTEGLAGNYGLATFLSVRVDLSTPSVVWAGSDFQGSFASFDAGAHWLMSSEGLPSSPSLGRPAIYALDASSSKVLYAATSRGVFRRIIDPTAGACALFEQSLQLADGRYCVGVSFRSPSMSEADFAHPAPLTASTGAFWFFDPTNLELIVKVLDGRSVNGKFWVFYGALSNVEYTITVTDTLTGAVKTYFNPQGQLASVADTSAF